MPKQRMTGGQDRRRSPAIATRKGKTPRQLAVLGSQRQAAYELWPREVQSLVEAERRGEEMFWEPEELDEEGSSDDDSEIDTADEDDPSEEADHEDTGIEKYLVRLRDRVNFPRSPKLDLFDYYVMTVVENTGGAYQCGFEAPSWFHQKLPENLSDHLHRLERFLSELARWLTEHKQEFLRCPCPQTYVLGETQFPDRPIIFQNGLASRINIRIADRRHRFTKHDMSRIVDKVLLVWPSWNMPLARLFSRECAKDWVIRGCLLHQQQYEVFPDEDAFTLSDEDVKSAMRQDFESLPVSQKLRVLCRVARVKPNAVLTTIATRMKQDRGQQEAPLEDRNAGRN